MKCSLDRILTGYIYTNIDLKYELINTDIIRSIEFIKTLVQQEYPNYDSQLELDKNELRELLYKLFIKFEEEKSEKIKEVKNHIQMI